MATCVIVIVIVIVNVNVLVATFLFSPDSQLVTAVSQLGEDLDCRDSNQCKV